MPPFVKFFPEFFDATTASKYNGRRINLLKVRLRFGVRFRLECGYAWSAVTLGVRLRFGVRFCLE